MRQAHVKPFDSLDGSDVDLRGGIWAEIVTALYITKASSVLPWTLALGTPSLMPENIPLFPLQNWIH